MDMFYLISEISRLGRRILFSKQTQSIARQVTSTNDHIRHFIKISFIIEEIDFIDLPSIFQDKSVAQYIPTYFQNSDSRIICYRYDKPIRNIIFSFNLLVSDLNIHVNTPYS